MPLAAFFSGSRDRSGARSTRSLGDCFSGSERPGTRGERSRVASRTHPGVAELHVDRACLGTARDVEADVQPELARHEVAEAHALREGALLALEALEVGPGEAPATEADQAEARVELPAQLEL